MQTIPANEETHLIQNEISDEESPIISSSSQEPMPEWTTQEKLIAILAASTACTSVIAMIFVSSPLTFFCGIMGLTLPGYSVVQQQKITEGEALKDTSEDLEENLFKFQIENERLQEISVRLEDSVSGLQDMEEALTNIKEMEVNNIDALEDQLKDSQEILESMEGNLTGVIIQNIISVVLSCDTDGDFALGPEEIQNMILRIEKIHGIEINDELFTRKILDRGSGIDAVMDIIKELLEDDPMSKPDDERVFTFLE
mmetsp:Transcript_8396/g.11974  ORF Transcript_8396/g.11974 Transcript_8396/m.11974 type:complete len:256 (-) Transcript_8396:337-1104(-)|eukprot:CAMPEP_0184864178 /NCGR_PEP_ID=MMETSP0580-20130426/14075_1 /TAXON_ID=1118495 /ORGANISM="Dactyliosolen fragilissimus" /LENGTH=255 /DNA_ID=CAMNT_0027362863 /DNA_START=108 /DNA_END=875 /DNA_ORIENTATION=-